MQRRKEFGFVNIAKIIDVLDINTAKKRQLALVYELFRRIGKEESKMEIVSTTDDVGEFFVNDMKYLDVEVFKGIYLDTGKRIIAVREISRGGIDEVHVYTRNIIKQALNFNAKYTIFAHNHPGGGNPSKADIEVTVKLKNALEVCDIELLDHIVIVDDSYISFAAEGLL